MFTVMITLLCGYRKYRILRLFRKLLFFLLLMQINLSISSFCGEVCTYWSNILQNTQYNNIYSPIEVITKNSGIDE